MLALLRAVICSLESHRRKRSPFPTGIDELNTNVCVGSQLQFYHPFVYHWEMAIGSLSVGAPDLVDVAIHGRHRQQAPWSNTEVLTTIDGLKVWNFAKASQFGKGDNIFCVVAPLICVANVVPLAFSALFRYFSVFLCAVVEFGAFLALL